jgi:hypothetical protein
MSFVIAFIVKHFQQLLIWLSSLFKIRIINVPGFSAEMLGS